MGLRRIISIFLIILKKIEPEYLILFPIIFIAYYYQLGVFPVYMWDEGVYASNAMEMINNGNILIKYFDNKPEMWATQPPLVAWFQALSMWVFGINETALRFPSALAATILSISLLRFLTKEFDSLSWGFFTALILSLSTGFVTIHVARTADLDIFVTLFNTLYIIYFYKLYKSGFKNTKFLFLFILFVFMAFWAKTIAGLIFLPVILFFILFSKNRLVLFKNIKFYLYSFSFILVTILYYWYHEYKTPGYIETAFINEFWGRFTGQIKDVHIQPFLFYWEKLRYSDFFPWIFFIPLSLFISFFKNAKERFLFLYLSLLILFYWVIISFSTVKLYWYTASLFPLLSIIASYSIMQFYELIIENIKIKKYIFKFFFLIVFTVSIFFNNIFIIERNNLINSRNGSIDLLYSVVLNNMHIKHPEIKEIFIFQPGFAPNVVFYKNYYNIYKGYQIRIYDITENITIIPDSYILFFNTAVTNILDNGYNYEIIDQYKDVVLVHVLNRKVPLLTYYGLDPDRDYDLLTQRSRELSNSAFTGKYSLKLSSSNEFSLMWKYSIKDLKMENINKIRVSFYAFSNNIENSGYFVYSGDSSLWNSLELKGILKEKNTWNKVDTTFTLESVYSSKNVFLHLYFWNNNQDSLLLDDIAIELLK